MALKWNRPETALTWGKPPPSNGGNPTRRKPKQTVIVARGHRGEIEDYAGTLIAFQAWCESRGHTFREAMLRAVKREMRTK